MQAQSSSIHRKMQLEVRHSRMTSYGIKKRKSIPDPEHKNIMFGLTGETLVWWTHTELGVLKAQKING
jgi:hypothetical protein